MPSIGNWNLWREIMWALSEIRRKTPDFSHGECQSDGARRVVVEDWSGLMDSLSL